MSRPVLEINTAPSADTWFSMISKCNQVIDIISNNAVTIGLTANGDTTTGNGMILGTLSANVLATATLRGR